MARPTSLSSRIVVTVCTVSVTAQIFSPWSLARTAQAEGFAAVASPLRRVATEARDGVASLRLDPTAYHEVKSADHMVLTGLVLDQERRVDVDVTQIDIFSSDAQVVLGTPEGDVPLPHPDVTLLSGTVVGEVDSLVFLGLSPHGNNGLIRIGDETFVLAADRRADGADAVVYNLSSLPPGAIRWNAWQCGLDELRRDGVGPTEHGLAWMPEGMGATASAPSSTRLVEMAIETDWEFTGSLFGGDIDSAGAYAATLIAAVSEIYYRDLDTLLEIGFLRLWATSDDPWDQTSTGDQLYQYRSYWNAYMSHVERHVTHFLSGRGLGGGVAWVGVVCNESWYYALSANLGGSFPYPLVDNNRQNWDVYVVAHETGHNFGAPHTHDMNPRIDNCGGGDCTGASEGTIMSYCHLCSGGMSNIALRFHDRIIDEEILPFLEYGVDCDLSGELPVCEIADPVTVDVHVATSRHLSIVNGNAGRQTAIRVILDDLPAPYDVLNGEVRWVGPPESFCENSGQSAPPAEGCENAPGLESRTFRSAELECGPYYRDWSTAGPVHVYGEAIVPDGRYVVQIIDRACTTSVEEEYSEALEVETSFWGDVVSDCTTTPCGPPDGTIGVPTDVTAVLDKFKNLPGAPIKARCDLEPALPDHLINITDLTVCLNAFSGFGYPFDNMPDPCP